MACGVETCPSKQKRDRALFLKQRVSSRLVPSLHHMQRLHASESSQNLCCLGLVSRHLFSGTSSLSLQRPGITATKALVNCHGRWIEPLSPPALLIEPEKSALKKKDIVVFRKTRFHSQVEPKSICQPLGDRVWRHLGDIIPRIPITGQSECLPTWNLLPAEPSHGSMLYRLNSRHGHASSELKRFHTSMKSSEVRPEVVGGRRGLDEDLLAKSFGSLTHGLGKKQPLQIWCQSSVQKRV